jgi:rsbT co-antagonist protein RsbR
MPTRWQRVQGWLAATQLRDPIERGQATAFQLILLFTIGLGGLFLTLILVGLVSGIATLDVLPFLVLASLLALGALGALVLMRRGRFQAAVLLAAVGITSFHSVAVIASQLVTPDLLLMYLLPITLAGLLSSRRALPLVIGIAISAVWIAALLAPNTAGTSLPSLNAPSPPLFIAFNFMIIAGLIGIFFGVFGNALYAALERALTREHELELLRNQLESTVQTRTADLQRALAEVEARAEAQEQLRRDAEEQRALVQRMAVPVLPVSNDTLVVPLVGSLDSDRIADLHERVLHAVEQRRTQRVVLDITGVPVVDSQVAQGLVTVMEAIHLLGAQALLVGIRPEVAQALVGLGVDLHALPTFSTLQAALEAHRPQLIRARTLT